MAGYELITTALCPRTAGLPLTADSRERRALATGQPPGRARPMTGSRRNRPDYADGETGGAFARRAHPCLGRCLRRPDGPASIGRNQTGLDQVQPRRGETAIPSELCRVYDVATT